MKLEFLWTSRGYRGPAEDWELPRGFRLLCLEPGWFAFFLGGRAVQSEPLALTAQAGEEAFLLGLPPLNADSAWLERGRSRLDALNWSAGVVALLADYRQRALLGPLRSQSRKIFSAAMPLGAALWIWQPMPLPRRSEGLAFFAVEQQLYQLGRIGRRVKRRCRWRSWLPW